MVIMCHQYENYGIRCFALVCVKLLKSSVYFTSAASLDLNRSSELSCGVLCATDSGTGATADAENASVEM